MDCGTCQEQLASLAADVLSGQTREAAERHLAECAGCREQLRDLEATMRLVADAAAAEPAATLDPVRRAALDRVAAEGAQPGLAARSRPRKPAVPFPVGWGPLLRVAAVLVALAAVALLVVPALRPPRTDVAARPADRAPERLAEEEAQAAIGPVPELADESREKTAGLRDDMAALAEQKSAPAPEPQPVAQAAEPLGVENQYHELRQRAAKEARRVMPAATPAPASAIRPTAETRDVAEPRPRFMADVDMDAVASAPRAGPAAPAVETARDAGDALFRVDRTEREQMTRGHVPSGTVAMVTGRAETASAPADVASDTAVDALSLTPAGSRASYDLARHYLRNGRLPPRQLVRPEEFAAAVSPMTRAVALADREGGAADGGAASHVWTFGAAARATTVAPAGEGGRTARQVILIADTSESMEAADRLGLVRSAVAKLAGRPVAGESLTVTVTPPVAVTMAGRGVSGVGGRSSAPAEADEGDSLVSGLRVLARKQREPAAAGGDAPASPQPVVFIYSDGHALTSGGAAELEALVRAQRARHGQVGVIQCGMVASATNGLRHLAAVGGGPYAFAGTADDVVRAVEQAVAAARRQETSTKHAEGLVAGNTDPDPVAVAAARLAHLLSRADGFTGEDMDALARTVARLAQEGHAPREELKELRRMAMQARALVRAEKVETAKPR